LNANNDRQTTRKTAADTKKKTTTTPRETKSNALTPIDTPGDKSFEQCCLFGKEAFEVYSNFDAA